MLNALSRAVDVALEATIVGSYTSVGYRTRSRIEDWSTPAGDLLGRRALVTGGSGGIGREIVTGLVRLGAEVTLTSRSMATAEAVAGEVNRDVGPGSATGAAVDTAEFDSVLDLARAVASVGPVDLLIHNAGALTADRRTNSVGMEETLASHLVGPYLLTQRLRPALAPGAHVIWMSSGGMYTQRLDVDFLEMAPSDYRGSVAYARAKRAMVELVTHLGPRWAPEVTMSAMHPGWVDTPGVESGLPVFHRVMSAGLRSPAEGADTMVWLAANTPEIPPGRFWFDRHERPTSYLPMTRCDDETRVELVEWLDRRVAPWTTE